MCNRFLLGLLLTLIVPAAFAKTALDLMIEGRFGEAKAILDTSNVSPRYQLLYFAMIESDAARACSLYQVVALRYPNSDCDTVARVRLDQAQELGFVVIPIAEWAQAAPGAAPLSLRRVQPRVAAAEVAAPEPVEPPTPIPSTPPPVLVAVPPLPVPETVKAEEPPVTEIETREEEPLIVVRDTITPVERAPEPVERPSVISSTPPPVLVAVPSLPIPVSPVAEPEPSKEEPQVSVRDTIITAEKVPEPAEPVVETVAPQPPPVVHEVIATPDEAPPEPVVKDTVVAPAPAIEPLPVKLPPTASAIEKAALPPAVAEPAMEAKEKADEPQPAPAPAVVETTPVAPPTASISLDRPASGGAWYIQVGAFANFDNAHRLALSLQNAGYPVKLVPRDSAKGKLLQVRVGGYASRDELPPIAEQLKEKFRVPTVFVTE